MYSHFLKYFRIICFELNLQEEHHLHFHMVCNTLKTSAAICSHILQSFTFIVYFKQSSQFDVCFATYTPSVTLYSCVGLLLLPENFAGRLSPKDKKNCLIQFLQILCISLFKITLIRRNVMIYKDRLYAFKKMHANFVKFSVLVQNSIEGILRKASYYMYLSHSYIIKINQDLHIFCLFKYTS